MVRRSGNRDKDGKKIKKKKKYDLGLELEDENPPEEPHMDFDIWNDPEEYDRGPAATYLNGTWWIGKHTTQDWFGNFILFCIIVAGVMVGIMTYKVMETNVAVVCVDEMSDDLRLGGAQDGGGGFAPSRYFAASSGSGTSGPSFASSAATSKWPFRRPTSCG